MKRTITLCLLLIFAWTLTQAQNKIEVEVQSTQAEFLGKTPPVRDLVPLVGISPEKKKGLKKHKLIPNFVGRGTRKEPVNPNAEPRFGDPVRQSEINNNRSIPLEPLVNIEGMPESVGGATPPDPCGQIGNDYYVQMVNATYYQVFDKQGNTVTAPIAMNTIWSSLGFSSAGDPIIMFDQEADRWIMTEFPSGNQLLVAVSESSDPLGSWYAYNFATPNFPDYPKYTIWPNAICVTTNEGGGLPSYFIDRQALLNNDPTVNIQRVVIPDIGGSPGFFVATPVNWTGPVAPPTGMSPMILRLHDDAWGGAAQDQIDIFTVDIDWANPNNTVVTESNVPTAAFDTDACAVAGGFGFDCIPQLNGGGIDGLPDVIMHQSHYRNFNSHESVVLNFLVNASSTNDIIAGIRWMELRRTPGNTAWSVYQEGTFAPEDGLHRFMGSMCMDGNGNIGLAYSVSGEQIYPGLRFTGRRASDPLGEMTIDEFEFATGGSAASFDRYGDYAQMSLDPANDRTFWFTGEYMANNGWATKIVSFELSRDSIDIGPTAMVTPASASLLAASEEVTIDVKNFGLETVFNFDVGYILDNGTAVIESVNTPLLSDSTYTHTFMTDADLSSIGEYNFKIFTSLPEDTAPLNDTLNALVYHLPRFDAAMTDIEGLDGQNCGEEITANMILTNLGTETLTSATIDVQLNGAAFTTVNWIGNLVFGASETVPVLLTGLVDGNNTVTATVSMPNGVADELMDNNEFEKEFDIILQGTFISLQLLTDNYPEETTWEVTEVGGNVLYSGGPYPGEQNTLIAEDFCVADGCYIFSIFDSYGDGLESTPWGGTDGGYEILDNTGNVLTSIINVNFGSQETNNFCTSIDCSSLSVNITTSPEIGTGNSNGSIMISATGGTPPFSYSINDGTTSQNNGTFTGLVSGAYPVLVTDANGCEYEEMVLVDFDVSLVDPISGATMEVLPNPTNGVFRINVSGINRPSPFLYFEIFNTAGQLIQTKSLVRYDGVYTAELSLAAYPAGVYYVRFKDSEIKRMLQVVKQ